MALRLYLHALRAARARQLRGRALRPIVRRRFPHGEPPRPPKPLPAAEALWRSAAFAVWPAPDPATRLGRFHLQYGEDVLEAARAGDLSRAQALVRGWIDGHPPTTGDPWHPYPLSTRIGNWVAALTLLPELASPELAGSLWRQLRRLTLNVEDDVLGNHVIRNARALVLGGEAFGDLALTRRGLELLRRELPEQVLRDGGHYERSPVYHLVVLRDLLEVQAVAPTDWLAGPVERMRTFAAALQRPDGRPPLFNDGGLDLAPQLDLPPPPGGLTVLPESGFAVVRDGPLWLAFRCGPAAPPFLPAHAHADALSLQLWWRGEPVIVDPGTYTYEPGADRDWFRGTRAHSTVTVDGRDQFELWGSFRTGPLPEVELHEARDGLLEASVRLPGAMRHVRRVEWRDGGRELVVRDRVEGSGRHTLESRLVWAPSGEAAVAADAVGTAGELEQVRLSERFGEWVASVAKVATTDAVLPSELVWTLRFEG